MADYPSLSVSVNSSATPVSGIVSERGADGTLRGQVLHADKLEFNVIHSYLTSAQVTTLQNFYDTNKALSFNFTWPLDGETYVCIFLDRPQWTALAGTARAAVVRLGEV